MGGTDDPPERNDDQDDDLKAGEEVSFDNNLFADIHINIPCAQYMSPFE